MNEEKPWGTKNEWLTGERFSMGQIHLLEGRRTSLHLHENQTHFWFVESGNGELILEDKIFYIGPGDSIHIDREETHRLSAMLGDMHVFYVTSGRIQEDDVIRFEDDYGRVSEGVD
jgi:mannose-6-phosphate isomerase-like protein (cupin superfamily)